MPYGIIKVDTVTFTDNGVDKTISLSGLVQNPTFTGNVTSTGTISGNIIRGGTIVSGATVTGTTANFVSGVFTTRLSGVTITGTTIAAVTGVFSSPLSVQDITMGRGGGAVVSNIALGSLALNVNTTGFQNTALGVNALLVNTTGSFNTALGLDTLYSNTTGASNVAVGLNSLSSNTIGNGNTGIGINSLTNNIEGADNTSIGLNSLLNITSATGNTVCGTNALIGNTSGSSNVAIGYGVTSSTLTVSNEVNISNNSVTARFQGAASAWTFVSDARDKIDVQNLTLGLDFIKALKPRTFKWNLRNTEVDRGKPSAGFIAQEVLETIKTFNASYTNLIDTNDPNQYTFAQANMIPMLVKATQELTAKVEALEARSQPRPE